MTVADQIMSRLVRPDFERWSSAAASTGHCANPVRLVGQSMSVDAASGQVLSRYRSADEPDGITYVRCGNRRAARCPSCSDEYKQDMWHLVSAGVAGGEKGVPRSVASHPLAFATLTAPSFGAVHSARQRNGIPAACRPRRSSDVCAHGRPRGCRRKHMEDDPQLGEPICSECYDYDAHVIWQWHAPELWRRFTIALRRRLAALLGLSERVARELVRVQYAKVAEFQRRGAVHFHALIRLDGMPRAGEEFPPPLVPVGSDVLCELVRDAAGDVSLTVPGVGDHSGPYTLRWGAQCDARAVRRHGMDRSGELTDRAVAAYIAKYATKATEDLSTSGNGRRTRPHIARLRDRVALLGRIARVHEIEEYALLSRWESMLGFRGHFSTKSRGYSTTLGQLRAERRAWQSCRSGSGRPAPADEPVLVIGDWTFAGMGWLTDGDRHLVAEAADRSLELRRRRRRSTHTTKG